MIHFSTVEQLIEELNLTPSQAKIAYLLEEKQELEAEIAALPKKTEKQILIDGCLKVVDIAFDFTVDQVLTKELHDQGKTQREIAEKLNISLGSVNKYLKKEQRKHMSIEAYNYKTKK